MIIITGASSGVGQFLVKYFEPNQQVFGIYHSSENPDHKLVKVDVTSYDQVEAWIESLPIVAGTKIVLLNCAGVNYNCFAHKADPKHWEDVISTNLVGTFNVIRCLLPAMRSAAYGRIINFGSVVAQKGVMGTSAYAASKSALWGFSKAIAAENAGKGININTINLGYSDVGMGLTQISDDKRQELLSEIPATRFCSPEEIARTIEYFVATEYVNGTSVDLSGGLT